MNNLILKVIENKDSLTVSLRELHKALGSKRRFADWVKPVIDTYGDELIEIISQVHGGKNSVRDVTDYAASVNTAKHICLMAKTDAGKDIRQYLINVEQAWNSPERVMARGLQAANEIMNKLKAELENKNLKIEEMQPKADFADAVAADCGCILVREEARIISQALGISFGEQTFYKWLREHKYVVRDKKYSDQNLPTQKTIDLGVMRIKESGVKLKGGGYKVTKTAVVTGKGQEYFLTKIKEFIKAEETEAPAVKKPETPSVGDLWESMHDVNTDTRKGQIKKRSEAL